MRTLVDRFRKIVRLLSVDSKTGHYISTVAHHASLSRHGTATERTENVTRAQITVADLGFWKGGFQCARD